MSQTPSHRILNLTGAPSTLALRKLGVFEPSAMDARQVADLLASEQAKLRGSSQQSIAEALAEIAGKSLVSYALIDPPAYLARALEEALEELEIVPVYVDGRLRAINTAEPTSPARLDFVVVRLIGL